MFGSANDVFGNIKGLICHTWVTRYCVQKCDFKIGTLRQESFLWKFSYPYTQRLRIVENKQCQDCFAKATSSKAFEPLNELVWTLDPCAD